MNPRMGRTASVSVALALLLPIAALAQSGPPGAPGADVSLASPLPPTSAALVEDASALSLNPGALAAQHGPEALFVFSQGFEGDRGAVLLGLPLGPLGFALGGEWAGTPDGTGAGGVIAPSRRLSAGIAAGGSPLRVGAAVRALRAEGSLYDGATTLDLGVLSRPTDWLSLGLTLHNAAGVEGLTRDWVVAAATRLFEGALELSVDGNVTEGRDGMGLGWTARFPLFSGVGLAARLTHRTAGPAQIAGLASLTVDLEGVGLSYGYGGSATGSFTHLVAARASMAPRPSISSTGDAFALLDLSAALSPSQSPLGALLGDAPEDPYLALLETLRQAAGDPRLSGLLVKVEGLAGLGMARALELRDALLALKTNGKRVVALLLSAGDLEYLVASAADVRLALPQSAFQINGLVARSYFLGETLAQVGVEVDTARVGRFKTSPEQLTRSSMSDAHREALGVYLDRQEAALFEALKGSGISRLRVEEAFALGLQEASRMKALGLVDAVIDPGALDREVERHFPDASFLGPYQPGAPYPPTWTPPRRIAVVPLLGTISGGRSRSLPLTGERIAGAESVISALERAGADPGVVAIILRIDSPGGGVLASDLIYRSVRRVAEKKPVVVSMGDVAASGGYYAAAAATRIVARPTTLTGSIGVFIAKPSFAGLLERLSVGTEALSTAPMADLLSTTRPWREDEQAAMQRWVDATYETFLALVAKRRGLSRDAAHAVAQGRIWSGEDALEHRLVDRLGGLTEALEEARALAGVGTERLDVVLLGAPQGLFGIFGGASGHTSRTGSAGAWAGDSGDPLSRRLELRLLAPGATPSGAEGLLQALGGALQPPPEGLQARLPFQLEID